MAELVLSPAGAVPCEGCGAQLAPGLLSCPGCSRLVHAAELRRIAAEAEAATAAGDRARALGLWQQAMPLLPPQAGQRAAISERIEALGTLAAVQPAAPAQQQQQQGSGAAKRTGLAGAITALLLKGKTILFFVLAKAKLLLFGLTKISTLLSMGPYLAWMWARYGWGLGAGILVSIYVHEMGHVSALRFYGMDAGAPVFIPGIGALIRLKQSPPNERVDARIGLAGPVWGLCAALAAYAVYLASGVAVWAAIARLGGWINLFNLIPIWQLDGGRAFNSLSRRQRAGALAAVLLAFALTHNGMLLLLAAGAAYRLFQPAPDRDDHGALGTYVGLVFALAALELLPGSRL